MVMSALHSVRLCSAKVVERLTTIFGGADIQKADNGKLNKEPNCVQNLFRLRAHRT